MGAEMWSTGFPVYVSLVTDRSACRAHDRAGQRVSSFGAEERGPVGEDPAVGRDQVIATVLPGHDADHRTVERRITVAAVEAGVTVGEDPAVGGRQPVAQVVDGGGDADDRAVEGECIRGAERADRALEKTAPCEETIQ